MSEFLNWTVLISSFLVIVCYIFRLKTLNFFNARTDYVACHLIWLVYAGWVFSQALYRYPLDFELLPLVGSALWLWINRGNGGPKKTRKAPGRPVPDESLRHVFGRGP